MFNMFYTYLIHTHINTYACTHAHVQFNMPCYKHNRYQTGGNEWHYPSYTWNCSCICIIQTYICGCTHAYVGACAQACTEHSTDLYLSGKVLCSLKMNDSCLLTQLNLDKEMTNTSKTFCRKIYWHIHMTFCWYHDKPSILTHFISTDCTEATLEMN